MVGYAALLYQIKNKALTFLTKTITIMKPLILLICLALGVAANGQTKSDSKLSPSVKITTDCVKSLYFDGSKYYYNDCEGAKEEVDIVPCYMLVTMGAVVSRVSGYRLKFRAHAPAISFDENYKEPVVYLLPDKKRIPEGMIVWMHKDK